MSYRYHDSIISQEKAEELIAQGKEVISPWSDIGYHIGVEQLSDPQQSLIFIQHGRDLTKPGAHAVGFNTDSYGICLIGNFDAVEPDLELWQTALAVVRGLMVKDNISIENVLGHWETFIRRRLAANKTEAQRIKTCPGLKFDMDKFRADLGTWTV